VVWVVLVWPCCGKVDGGWVGGVAMLVEVKFVIQMKVKLSLGMRSISLICCEAASCFVSMSGGRSSKQKCLCMI
jgi:hypothetical protein